MAGQGCHICAALTAHTVEDMLLQAREAKTSGADVVEMRLDHIAEFEPSRDLPMLLVDPVLPTIVTFRPSWEGGCYEGDEHSRLNALRMAMELGAAFVDVELQVAEPFIRSRRPPLTPTKVIVSNHNYDLTPSLDDLTALVARIQSTGADVVKFATTANDVSDAVKVFVLLSRVQVPTIALVMGLKGQISRLLAPKFGAFLTFGSLGSGRESAPGQPTVAELAQVYHVGRVGPTTKVFGLIGNPVSHSKGPILHNLGLLERGIDGVYVPFLVDDVKTFLRAFDSPDFAGFSVTIPHKQTALKCCDEVDPIAMAIGAVNTIVRRPSDGKLVGYNTDAGAAIAAIEEGLRQREGATGGAPGGSGSLAGRLVVVIGAGGAGRALAFGAKAKGAAVLIANRNFGRAKDLAESVGAQAIPLADVANRDEVQRLARLAGVTPELMEALPPVLANTTSVGMQPNVGETPVPKAALIGYSVVFDAVYTPMETRLLKEGRMCGATAVSGLEMFVGQAAEQFELFTGFTAPKDIMREAVLRSLQS